MRRLSKEEARLQQAEIRRRKRNEQKQAWARPAPVYESEKEEEWTLSEHLTRTCAYQHRPSLSGTSVSAGSLPALDRLLLDDADAGEGLRGCRRAWAQVAPQEL